jgi:hypothetical protein
MTAQCRGIEERRRSNWPVVEHLKVKGQATKTRAVEENRKLPVIFCACQKSKSGPTYPKVSAFSGIHCTLTSLNIDNRFC